MKLCSATLWTSSYSSTLFLGRTGLKVLLIQSFSGLELLLLFLFDLK